VLHNLVRDKILKAYIWAFFLYKYLLLYVIIVIERGFGEFMKIKKIPNEREKCYDIELIDNNKKLKILFAGNLDLYMVLGNNEIIPENENVVLFFDITKEDYEIYSIFDSLYRNIIDGKPLEKDEYDEEFFDDDEIDYKNTYQYKILVDNDHIIRWVSDDGPYEEEDRLRIKRLDDDTYRLIFIRNDKPLTEGMKSGFGIAVRFRNSGSRYQPFNCLFMKMYHELQSIDPDYHQIHMEEIEYLKKKKIKDKRKNYE